MTSEKPTSTSPKTKNHWVSRYLPDDPRTLRQLAIALGPLPILCFIWSFYIVTFISPVVLPDKTFIFVRDNSQVITLISVAVATILAGCASLFFALAIRYIVTIHLSTGHISLYALGSATRIAEPTFWLNDPRVKWTWIVLVAYAIVKIQATTLASFLSVQRIEVPRDVVGYDLDISNAQLRQQITQNKTNPTLKLTTDPSLLLVSLNALDVAMGNRNRTFKMGINTFMSNSGGILQASFFPTPFYTGTGPGHFTTIPANIRDPRAPGPISPPTVDQMALNQQGFSADVDCRPSAQNDTAVTEYISTQLVTEEHPESNFTLFTMMTTCSKNQTTRTGPVSTPLSPGQNPGVLLMDLCGRPQTSSYALAMRATGSLSAFDNVTCTVAPKVTTVNVTYFNPDKVLSFPTSLRVAQPDSEFNNSEWGEMALRIIRDNVFAAQGPEGNTVGDGWYQSRIMDAPDTPLLEALNIYIRGCMEFTGTALRQQFYQPGGILTRYGWRGMTDSMRVPIKGNYTFVAHGWHQDTAGVSSLYILPTTIVILTTYILLAYGIVLTRMHGDKFNKDEVYFDFTDIAHVIAARSPEARENFKNFSDSPRRFLENTQVYMREMEGMRGLGVSSIDRRAAAPDGQERRGRSRGRSWIGSETGRPGSPVAGDYISLSGDDLDTLGTRGNLPTSTNNKT